MDLEKKKRRQSLRIIISETIMVIAVIIMVVVLAFLASGYWINSDFEVERQGMLQISSIPTGADVIIDDESAWLQRTNTSKVLSSGEHRITLKKEGYDTWSRTVNISKGLLYSIHYPRLFLLEREAEKTLPLNEITMSTISPDHESLLLINNTTEWSLIDLTKEKLEPTKIDIADVFSGITLPGGATTSLFTGEILDIVWDRDNTHALFKVKNGETLDWVLLDIKNPEKSISLAKYFDVSFSTVEILDNSSNNLLAVRNNNLYKIDVSGRQISTVLINNIYSFDHYNNDIVFVACGLENIADGEEISISSISDTASESENCYVGFMKLGDNKLIKLSSTPKDTKIVLSRFYDERYITTLIGQELNIYKKEDFTKENNFSLGFAPQYLEVGHNGEFILAYNDNLDLATLDMEARAVREWKIEGEKFGWIDNDMIYTVKDGELIVYDFDGLNRRALAKNISARFPAGITDNKWLYYVSDEILIREWLVPR